MKYPNISVVIPTKNRRDEILRALVSVEMQTVHPLEIIVVDDFSDSSIELQLANFSMSVDLKFIRSEVPLGPGMARNVGGDASKGEIIAFLDSDDCFMPNYIEEISKAWLSLEAGVGVLATGFLWTDSNLKPYREQLPAVGISRDVLLKRGNVVGGCSVLSVRKQTFKQVGGFFRAGGSEDFELLLRMAAVSEIHSMRAPLVLYQSPTHSAGPAVTKNYKKQISAIHKINKTLNDRDRKMFAEHRRDLLALMHANEGRRYISTALVKRAIMKDHRISSLTLRVSLILLLGGDVMRNVMAISSHFKMLNGRKKFGAQSERVVHEIYSRVKAALRA